MKLAPSCCPECGSPAFALTEIVYLDAFLTHDTLTDDYAYTGASTVIWETQAPARPTPGAVEAQCAARHFWTATATPDVDGLAAITEALPVGPMSDRDAIPAGDRTR